MMSGNTASGRKCPRCGKNSIILDELSDEIFCSGCGYVVSKKDQESELGIISQNKFDNKNGITETSQNAPDIGSSTTINPSNKDSSGKPLSSNVKNSIKKLRGLDNRSKTNSSAEKNFKKAEKEMSKLKDKLALSNSVIEKAKQMYQKIIDRKRTRGYSIEGHVGACIYASCKITNMPRSMESIANSMGIKKIEIRRSYKMIWKELELEIPLVDPVKYVAKIASVAGFSEKTRREAIRIIEQVKKTGIIVGKEPRGIVAGALHVAGFKTGEPKSEKIIAEASGITVGTLIERSKDFEKILEG